MPLTRVTSQLISIPSNYPLTGSLNGTASYAITSSFAMNGGINGAQLAKAWVNFNGTGTVAIRDSYNVSSITDLGTGNYTINYATTFSNANYCVNASAREFAIYTAAGGNITTGSVRVSVYNSAIAIIDTTHVFVSVFGN